MRKKCGNGKRSKSNRAKTRKLLQSIRHERILFRKQLICAQSGQLSCLLQLHYSFFFFFFFLFMLHLQCQNPIVPGEHAIPLMLFSKLKHYLKPHYLHTRYGNILRVGNRKSKYQPYPNSVKPTYESPDHYKWPFSSINV